LKPEIGFGQVIATDNIGKLSIVGVGMKSHTGVAGKMFETLAREGVNIEMISTSEIKVSVIVELSKASKPSAPSTTPSSVAYFKLALFSFKFEILKFQIPYLLEHEPEPHRLRRRKSVLNQVWASLGALALPF